MTDSRDERVGVDARWSTFDEAREAIATMPLRELERRVGEPAPPLLPLSGWALAAGVAILVFGLRSPGLFVLGVAVAGYGLLAVVTNRNRAALFRERCYRRWVQGFADELEDEDEDRGEA